MKMINRKFFNGKDIDKATGIFINIIIIRDDTWHEINRTSDTPTVRAIGFHSDDLLSDVLLHQVLQELLITVNVNCGLA